MKDRLAQMMDPKSYKHIIILSEQKFENGSSKYTLDQYQEALFMRLKEKFESKYSIFLIQSIFDPGPDFLKQSSVHNSPIHETHDLFFFNVGPTLDELMQKYH